MKKGLIIGITLLIILIGSLFYFGNRTVKPDENKIPTTYNSIDIYNKGGKTLLGSIRIENEKVVSNVTDKGISDFINANKTLWEESQLEHMTGGKTETGVLWDGVAKTTVSDKNHIISIYEIIYREFGDDYRVSLSK